MNPSATEAILCFALRQNSINQRKKRCLHYSEMSMVSLGSLKRFKRQEESSAGFLPLSTSHYMLFKSLFQSIPFKRPFMGAELASGLFLESKTFHVF